MSMSPAASQWEMTKLTPAGYITVSWLADKYVGCLEVRTTSAGSFQYEGGAVLLRASSLCLTSHPITEGKFRHPVEETHFCRLYLWSRSFDLRPELMAKGESWNVDSRIVKSHTSVQEERHHLWTSYHSYNQLSRCKVSQPCLILVDFHLIVSLWPDVVDAPSVIL